MKRNTLFSVFLATALSFACFFLAPVGQANAVSAETTETPVTSATVAPVLYNPVEQDSASGLVGAVTNSVDAVRFLMTAQAGVNENHLDLYFGLKETVDISNGETVELQVRALKNSSGSTSLDTKIKFYLIDGNGTVVAARTGTGNVAYENGTTGVADYANMSDGTSYAWQGFSCIDASTGRSVRTYSFTKDNFIDYPLYNGEDSVMDYTDIRRAIVEAWTPLDGGTFYQFEVMNLSTTANGTTTNLFSASNATEGTSREVGANEWYFDSIPSATPYTAEQKAAIPVIIEQVKAKDGGITTFNAGTTNDSWLWLSAYTQLENGNSDIANAMTENDYSAYDRIAFDVDTTSCATDVSLEIKVYWSDDEANVASDSNRYFCASTDSFRYVPEDGEPFLGDSTKIKAGFKGTVFLDLSTFLQDGVGGSYLKLSHQKALANRLRFIMNPLNTAALTDGTVGVNKLSVKNIRFVDAVKTTLHVEKFHGVPATEYPVGTNVSEILSQFPANVSVSGDLIKTVDYGTTQVEEITEKTFVQLSGVWSAGELDENNNVTLTFTPDSAMTEIYDNYTFEENVSFSVSVSANVAPPAEESPDDPNVTPDTETPEEENILRKYGTTILKIILKLLSLRTGCGAVLTTFSAPAALVVCAVLVLRRKRK